MSDLAKCLLALHQAAEVGLLRRVDWAVSQWSAQLGSVAPAECLAWALCSHAQSAGHLALPLDQVLADPQAWLGESQLTQAQSAAWLALRAFLPASASAWRDALRVSPAVQVAPVCGPMLPWVLDGMRLYTQRQWRLEQRVLAQVRRRVAGTDLGAAPASWQTWLATLFPASPAATGGGSHGGAGGMDWQRAACAVALGSPLSVITGGPGTGKTYTAARVLAALWAQAQDPRALRVALAAPTGKAAARLMASIRGALAQLGPSLDAHLPSGTTLADLVSAMPPASTLHRWLGARPGSRRFRHDAQNPWPVDVVLIDEASMVHVELMADVLDAIPDGARVILLGDKDQLASVEAGAVLGDLCRPAQEGHYRPATAQALQRLTGGQVPPAWLDEQGSALSQRTVMLRESRRFSGPIGAWAQAINEGALPDPQPAGGQVQVLEACSLETAWRLACEGRGDAPGWSHYAQLVAQPPDPALGEPAFHAWVKVLLREVDRVRVLCALRSGPWGVDGMNEAITAHLTAQGWLKASGPWWVGRPVMVTRNAPALGVFNGDVGIALKPPGSARLKVYFPGAGDELLSVAVGRLADVETAFAMTVHKSQGSEFDHTLLVLPDQPSPVLTRELVYTGITRAKSALTLISGGQGLLAWAAARPTRRVSGLAAALHAPEGVLPPPGCV